MVVKKEDQSVGEKVELMVSKKVDPMAYRLVASMV